MDIIIITEPAILPVRCIEPYPRIKIVIQDVNDEIYKNKDNSAYDYAPHYHRIVPLYYPVHRKSSDAVPAENRLCKHGAV